MERGFGITVVVRLIPSLWGKSVPDQDQDQDDRDLRTRTERRGMETMESRRCGTIVECVDEDDERFGCDGRL